MKSATVTLKSDKEHLHERKELYIGNCDTVLTEMWVLEKNQLVFKEVLYNEGYFKLINEIIDNAVDEYIKTDGKFATEISFNVLPNSVFEISDNGRGISSQKDLKSDKTQVELAFCFLKAGSNWGEDKTVQIGANGIGASAVNMMSDFFQVETWDGTQKTELVCKDEASSIQIKHKKNSSKRGTKVTFKINNRHFNNVNQISPDLIYQFCYKRIIELYSSYPRIRFKFNGQLIHKKIWDFLPLEGRLFKFKGIEMGIFFKDSDSDEVPDLSYVNGINTYRGGTHVKFIKRKINELIRQNLEKKTKSKINNSFLNSHLLYSISLTGFMKAEFNTQNKTELINSEKEISDFLDRQKEICQIIVQKFYSSYSDRFKKICETIKNQNVEKLIKEVQKSSKRLKRIPKFLDALDKNRKDTILFLVEGDSAKGHFEVVRDIKKHGLFCLRGKVLNVIKHSTEKVLKNEELMNIMNILKIQIGEKVKDPYFDKIGILADADVDGDHISVMVILFFYKFFPDLFHQGRILKILSPIVIAKKGKQVKKFYSYEEFLKEQSKYSDWQIKYNKGLGGLKRDEYRELLSDLKYEVLTIEDMKSLEELFHVLFGKETENRQDWLKGKNIFSNKDEN